MSLEGSDRESYFRYSGKPDAGAHASRRRRDLAIRRESRKPVEVEQKFMPLGDLIDSLAQAQIDDLHSAAVPRFNDFDPGNFLPEYLSSDLFTAMYQRALEQAASKKEPDTEFIKMLTGEIFANIALSFQAHSEYPLRVVLNQQRTDDLFRKIQFEKTEEVDMNFGHKGLRLLRANGNVRWISNPDSILLAKERGRMRIAGLVEYKADVGHPSDLNNQLFGYAKRIFEQREFHPSLLVADPRNSVVMPTYPRHRDAIEAMLSTQGIGFVEYPFDITPIHEISSDIFRGNELRIRSASGQIHAFGLPGDIVKNPLIEILHQPLITS